MPFQKQCTPSPSNLGRLSRTEWQCNFQVMTLGAVHFSVPPVVTVRPVALTFPPLT
jgi:hypothetical protein